MKKRRRRETLLLLNNAQYFFCLVHLKTNIVLDASLLHYLPRSTEREREILLILFVGIDEFDLDKHILVVCNV